MAEEENKNKEENTNQSKSWIYDEIESSEQTRIEEINS